MSLSVKLFTHTDLDGVGCSVVGQVVFGTPNVDVTYCNYNDVNERVETFLDNRDCNRYDIIFITDISVNEQVAKKIDSICGDKMVLLDHHVTAEFLNQYSWAEVADMEIDLYDEKGKFQKSSGTSAFYTWCIRNKLYPENTDLEGFVEAVRQYDTWEWKTRFNSFFPKELNDLLYLIGRYPFVHRWIKNQGLGFTQSERQLLDIEIKRRDYYINQHRKAMRKLTTEEGYKVGVVFAESYISELGNILAEENDDLDFIAIINMTTGTFSYRATRGTVHLGEYAKLRGGGGHVAAAGSPITSEFIDEIIFRLINNKW